MNVTDKIEQLKARLQQPLPGVRAQELMAARVLPMPLTIPGDARASAVLCLLYPVDGELNMLLMKRMEDKGAHSGQVSFPGGRHEEFDADMLATALREANEEVGIRAADVTILGGLTSLYIPVSKFQVYPFVAYAPARPEYHISKSEVAYTLEVPLNKLWHAGRKKVIDVTSPAVPNIIRQVMAYVLEDGTIIWGATAMIISELEVAMNGFPAME